MVEFISLLLAVVSLAYMAFALITGVVTGGQFMGVIILSLILVNVVDYIRERRENHEQAADAGAEKEDC